MVKLNVTLVSSLPPHLLRTHILHIFDPALLVFTSAMFFSTLTVSNGWTFNHHLYLRHGYKHRSPLFSSFHKRKILQNQATNRNWKKKPFTTSSESHIRAHVPKLAATQKARSPRPIIYFHNPWTWFSNVAITSLPLWVLWADEPSLHIRPYAYPIRFKEREFHFCTWLAQ